MNERHELPANKTPDASGKSYEADLPGEEISESRTRRGFISGFAKKLAYAAPVVLLLCPKQASATAPGMDGTGMTQWDGANPFPNLANPRW